MRKTTIPYSMGVEEVVDKALYAGFFLNSLFRGVVFGKSHTGDMVQVHVCHRDSILQIDGLSIQSQIRIKSMIKNKE